MFQIKLISVPYRHEFEEEIEKAINTFLETLPEGTHVKITPLAFENSKLSLGGRHEKVHCTVLYKTPATIK